MNSDLEFYIDADGNPAAGGEDERLAVYLQTDIQGSASIAQELIMRLEDPNYRGEFNGNAHSVDIRENSVMIEANFDEDAPDRCVSRDEMLITVKAWLDFINAVPGSSTDDHPPA